MKNTFYLFGLKRPFIFSRLFSYSRSLTLREREVSSPLSNQYNFYNDIKIFLKNKPINEKTQIEIEEFLLNNAFRLLDTNKKINEVPISIYSNKISEILISFKEPLQEKIKKFMYKNRNCCGCTPSSMLFNIIKNTDTSYVLTILLGRFIKILSAHSSNIMFEKNLVLDITLDLSNDLIREYFYSLYKVYKKENPSKTFSEWKDNNPSKINYFDDQNRVKIGAILIEWLEDCNLLSTKLIKIDNKNQNVLIPAPIFIEELKKSSTLNNIISSPIRLPLIVKPKSYVPNNKNVILGGYLLNDVKYSDPLILPNYSLKKQASINNENIIYDTINKINSVGFKININMLDFINKNPFLFDDELIEQSNPLQYKKKLTKKEKILLQTYFNKLNIQTHILNIANAFSNIPELFFVSRMDNRGRIYCVTEYLNFQSTDLAKSLLLFSKSTTMKRLESDFSVMWFKAYGANCFGGKIEKLSLEDKSKWVDSNTERILNFEINNDIIKQAESKLLFTAFCFEFKRWHYFYNSPEMSEFTTNFPIQLDASCNGFQHLVLLSGDTNLRQELNLTSAKPTDKPSDFYSFVLELLKEHLNELDFEKLDEAKKDSYKRIKKFCLDRNLVKKMIMTIPYNATSRTIVTNMTKELNSYWEKQGDDIKRWFFISKDDPNKKLSFQDLYFLVVCIKDILDATSPKIFKLKKYLKQISFICTKLEVHIPWLLPSGLKVRQSYTEEKQVKIKPFSYSKTSLSLSKFTKKLDLNKQTRAFMPNLIHSLDATSLILLLNKYFYTCEFQTKNIYTIHDCFAMPMNHIEYIINNLRLVYTKLYSDSGYLKKLDEGIISTISLQYEYVHFNREKGILKVKGDEEKIFSYPDIKEIIGESLPKLNENILYIIK